MWRGAGDWPVRCSPPRPAPPLPPHPPPSPPVQLTRRQSRVGGGAVRHPQPSLGKLLALGLVQHHAMGKPAVVAVPPHLPATLRSRRSGEGGERQTSSRRSPTATQSPLSPPPHLRYPPGLHPYVFSPPPPSPSPPPSLEVPPWPAPISLLAVLDVLLVLSQVGVQPHSGVAPRQLGGWEVGRVGGVVCVWGGGGGRGARASDREAGPPARATAPMHPPVSSHAHMHTRTPRLAPAHTPALPPTHTHT